jgi:AraC-like DNA-binding protein
MQAPGTVSMDMLSALAHALVQAGVNVPSLLADVGIPPDVLETPGVRVPIALAERAFEEGAIRAGVPHISLRAASAIPVGVGTFLDCHIRTSATCGEALRRAIRYFGLINDQAILEIDTSSEATRIIQRGIDAPVPRRLAEFQLAVLVARGRALTGQAFALGAVGFTHAAPPSVAAYVDYFGCEVRFGQPVDEAILPSGVLDLPLPSADPGLASVLERYGRLIVARLPARRSFLDDARRCIVELLRDGEPTLDTTATRLGLSRRTLQRKLQALETSHNDLVDTVRRELALRALAGTDLNITEIAYMLGFSEPTAFHRAFKRWTGRTPAEHRRGTGTLPPPARAADDPVKGTSPRAPRA